VIDIIGATRRECRTLVCGGWRYQLRDAQVNGDGSGSGRGVLSTAGLSTAL